MAAQLESDVAWGWWVIMRHWCMKRKSTGFATVGSAPLFAVGFTASPVTRINRLQKNAFYGATGGMLRGFAYQIRRTLSTASCVRDCMLDPRCVSINYYLGSENRCELNNATKSQFPGNFSKLQLGSVYFDNNSSTMFSLASVPCGELMTTPA